MSAFLRQLGLHQAMAATFCLGVSAWAPSDALAEPTAMEEVLGILRAEGVIDQAAQEKLLAKYAGEQKQAAQDAAGILGGFEWSGDLRVRYEAFRFDEDALGSERDDRDRFRFRGRFGFKKKVNDWVKVGVRLASGGGDKDSTNQTLGGNDDFANDQIFFDRAWIDLTLMKGPKSSVNLVAGRVPNPYTWSNGKDLVLWDGDINPEGAYLSASYTPTEKSELFFSFGSFIARENSGGSDPKIVGTQIGYTGGSGNLGFGIRTSLYEYRSLDDGFLTAAFSEGNAIGNFTRDAMGNINALSEDGGAFDDGRARVADLTGFLSLSASDSLPILLYATYARNFEADSFTFNDGTNVVGIDDEDTAWGIGLEIGDKKKNVKFGIGYFHLEANSVVSQFTDSDLFDGRTNREGFIVYLSRQVAKNTEFGLTYFDGDEIEDDGAFLGSAGPIAPSLADADRRRLQADFQVKF